MLRGIVLTLDIVDDFTVGVSSATNRMSLKYKLTGGAAAQEFLSRSQVTQAGTLAAG